MKKTDTIAFYRDAYLEGKSDEERRMFDEKGIDKQYGCIMAWKRRARLAAQGKSESKSTFEPVTVSSILALLKKAKEDIAILEKLNDAERGKLQDAISGVKDEVDNFDRYRLVKLVEMLESKREEINKEEEKLRRQIEELRQQLS